MPPAISDDERSDIPSDEGDILPPKKPQPKKPAANSKAEKPVEDEPMPDIKNGNISDNNEDDDDDEEEDGEDEYVVEKILSHALGEKDVILYEVKWLGYESKDDRTWEPEENLAGAIDILKQYWKTIGGKPEAKPKTPAKAAKRGAKRKSGPAADTPTSSTPAKRGRKPTKPKDEPDEPEDKNPFKNPEGSWEHLIQGIDAIEEGDKSSEDKQGLQAYVLWEDNTRTCHSTITLREKCPQKLLDYYESKLFVENSKPKTRRRRTTNKT